MSGLGHDYIICLILKIINVIILIFYKDFKLNIPHNAKPIDVLFMGSYGPDDRRDLLLKNISKSPKLLLSLFEFRILFVDDIQFSLTANDLTINASFFYGCSNFHCYLYL
jgi:hypothetical protein